jgi:hypothetical protein
MWVLFRLLNRFVGAVLITVFVNPCNAFILSVLLGGV